MKQSVVGWQTSIRIGRQRAELQTYLVATLFNLGSTLEKLKRYDEAITANQQAGERSRAARETFPDKETWSIRMAGSHLNVARLQRMSNRPAEVVQAWREVRKLEP